MRLRRGSPTMRRCTPSDPSPVPACWRKRAEGVQPPSQAFLGPTLSSLAGLRAGIVKHNY